MDWLSRARSCRVCNFVLWADIDLVLSMLTLWAAIIAKIARLTVICIEDW